MVARSRDGCHGLRHHIWGPDTGAAPSIIPPANVTEVPSVLPSKGVEINHQALLRPTHYKSPLSRQEAIKLVSHYARIGPIAPKAILVNFTAPQTLRPAGYQGPATVIANVPAWVCHVNCPYASTGSANPTSSSGIRFARTCTPFQCSN